MPNRQLAHSECPHPRRGVWASPASHSLPAQRPQLMALSWPVGPLMSIHTPEAAATVPSERHSAPVGHTRHCCATEDRYRPLRTALHRAGLAWKEEALNQA